MIQYVFYIGVAALLLFVLTCHGFLYVSTLQIEPEAGISNSYCATNSGWLRFCPWLILFKY
jgi:hypothetical protein